MLLLKFCSVSLSFQKLIYSLKSRFLWCGESHEVSVSLLKVRIVRLVFTKRLFGVVRSFSAARFVPRGFIDKSH